MDWHRRRGDAANVAMAAQDGHQSALVIAELCEHFGRLVGVKDWLEKEIERTTSCNLVMVAAMRASAEHVLSCASMIEKTLHEVKWKHYAQKEEKADDAK